MADKQEKLFLVGTHRYSFRAGTPAEIVGTTMITPEGHEPRPCFVVKFDDGTEDMVSIFTVPGSTNKNSHYEFITEADVRAGKIPEVIH
jgi:hypothetical protein